MRQAAIALAATVLMSCCSAPRSPLTETVQDSGWDAAFTPTDKHSGWTGGDIAHSIDLRDGRVLWLFGDSFFGRVQDGKRVGEGTVMQRAAIAWHERPKDGDPPAATAFAGADVFHGVPRAEWTQPSPGIKSELGPDVWYWLMNDGIRLTHDRFVLFTTALGPSGNPDGMWNFRRVGGAILEIQNPFESPERWRWTSRLNPLVTPDPRFGERPAGKPGFNHALAILEREEAGERAFYLYGLRYGNEGGPMGSSKSLIVARATERTLTDPPSWRFFDGKTWSPRQEAAAVIAESVSDEFTIEPVRIDGRDVLVMIHGESFLGRHIMARTALRPQGPWSPPKVIAEVTDIGEGVMVYAAKGHAHLSRPGELLVSTATNADFGKVFADASLYRPNFFRVPLSVLPPPPAEATSSP